MRIANFELENIIEFSDKVQVLVVENPKKYYKFCDMLLRQSQGEEGSFILSKNYKELSFSKDVFIIPNLFDIDNYDRKFINKLYSDLDILAKENYYKELNELNLKVISFLEKLSFDSVFSLDYDLNFNLNSLFKMYKIDFAKEKEVFLEKLIDYVSVIIKYLQPKILIIFGLKSVLSDDETDEFYKFISYHSTKLLLIETHQFEKRTDEKVLLIDKDLCELTF